MQLVRSSQPVSGVPTSGGYSDLLNVISEGNCVGDGSVNDDTNWLSCIATGRSVYIPENKIIKITSPFTLNPYQQIIGGSHYTSVIKYSSSTGICVTCNSLCNIIDEITLQQDPAFTPVSGNVGLYIGHPSVEASGIMIQNVDINNFYDNFSGSEQATFNKLKNVACSDAVHANFSINYAVPHTLGWMLDCTSYHSPSAGTNTVGVLYRQCDTSNTIGLHIAGGATGLWLMGDTGVLANQTMLGISCENQNYSGSYSIRIGDGSYAVQAITITGLENYPSSSLGISVGSHAVDVQLAKVLCQGGATANLSDAGSRTVLEGVLLEGTTGLTLSGSGTIVKNVRTPNGKLTTTSGASLLDIQGNYFPGSNSIHANSWAGSIIKNNRGITDIAASVGATPFYVGQFAIVAGVAYMATGTSSSADWKQIS